MTKSGRLARWILLGESALVYLFLYAPIIILVVFSFNSSRYAIWEGFSLDWYRAFLQDDLILRSIKNSLIVAATATVISTFIGTLAALGMQRFEFRGKGALDGLFYLPVIVPEIVMAASLVIFFGSIHFTLSMSTVIIAHVAFCVSYVIIVVRARLEGFDRTLEEAAMDLGANPFETFYRITLPIIFPGILSGALLAFTLSIDDYMITSFVAGVGSTTLPLQIYSMVKTRVTPEINAVSTVLLIPTIILIIISDRLQRERN
ncbi:MAG: spermidine/putrescine ABC transporter permease PotC [Acidobacteria bacterium]|nr:MAG: spermidine/putrescine ABC transporter permease PotC [Acidobacteriota bacterium]